MTDYGQPLTFGLSLDPSVDRLPETRRLARAAEAHGLEYLAVQDHPYQPGHLDAWTMVSHLAAETSAVSFLTDVADLQLRPPAMLAKAAASLSVLTGGRVVLGVGGGASRDAIAAMDGPPRRGARPGDRPWYGSARAPAGPRSPPRCTRTAWRSARATTATSAWAASRPRAGSAGWCGPTG